MVRCAFASRTLRLWGIGEWHATTTFTMNKSMRRSAVDMGLPSALFQGCRRLAATGARPASPGPLIPPRDGIRGEWVWKGNVVVANGFHFRDKLGGSRVRAIFSECARSFNGSGL
jgi:hypothetical protein